MIMVTGALTLPTLIPQGMRDSVSIDIELEKQLNKHFGISSSAGTGKKATSSFMGVVCSASSLGATNTTNTDIGSFKAVPST